MDSLSNTPVTADTLIAEARAMAPALQTREDAAEAARRVPDESLSDMRAAGLFRAFQPARYGGHELDLDLLPAMGTELARGCGSSAWVGNLAMVHQWMHWRILRSGARRYVGRPAHGKPGCDCARYLCSGGRSRTGRGRIPDFREMALRQWLRSWRLGTSRGQIPGDSRWRQTGSRPGAGAARRLRDHR